MPEQALFCIDMGTTRTRVWLLQGEEILSCRTAEMGARNNSSASRTEWMQEQLLQLMREAEAQAGWAQGHVRLAVAAGMITSPQGLREVPHIPAPATGALLAAAMQPVGLAEGRTLWLVPGVRSVAGSGELSDVMRGEETLCVGLDLRDATVLNLGSHWKWITIDDRGRIAESRTSLAGELLHVLQEHTLLAASLPQGPPAELDEEWIECGLHCSEEQGLTRSLFRVRLLHLQGGSTPEQRQSFLYGVVLADELAQAQKQIADGARVVITGAATLARVWQKVLGRHGIQAAVVSEEDRERAYLRGLRLLFEMRSAE